MTNSQEQAEQWERFEQLYRETRVPILAYLLRRVDQSGDAADLLGEVYVVAWRRIDDVPINGQARLWLYGVARRVLANHHRREDQRTRLGDRLREQLEHHTTPNTGSDDPLAELVQQSLQGLPAADRELIQLNIWEELRPNEIAQVTGKSPAAVRVRLHRIRRQLAANLPIQAASPASLSDRAGA